MVGSRWPSRNSAGFSSGRTDGGEKRHLRERPARLLNRRDPKVGGEGGFVKGGPRNSSLDKDLRHKTLLSSKLRFFPALPTVVCGGLELPPFAADLEHDLERD